MEIQRMGLGMAAIGRPAYINIQKQSIAKDKETYSKNAQAILKYAFDQGIRYFDLARGYGLAEVFFAEFSNSIDSNDYTLATKWGYEYLADWKVEAQFHERKEHSLEMLNLQFEQSNEILPKIDVYQIHSATPDSRVLLNDEVLNRMFELKKQYRFKLGLTSSGLSQREILNRALELNVGAQPLFDYFQLTYNVFDPHLADVIEKIKSDDRKVVIKEALANGRVFRNEDYTFYNEMYDTLQGLADKYDVGVDAIAIRYCLDSTQADLILSGALTKDQLSSNLDALNFKLTSDEIAQLRSLADDPEDYWADRKALKWQ